MKGVSNRPQTPPTDDSVSTRDLGSGVLETTVRTGGQVHVYKYDVYADRWLDEPSRKPDFLWENQRD